MSRDPRPGGSWVREWRWHHHDGKSWLWGFLMYLHQLTQTLNPLIRRQSPGGMEPEGIMESDWNGMADSSNGRDRSELLLNGTHAYDFEKPSAIQRQAILPCMTDTEGHHGFRRLHGASCHACFGVPACLLRCRSCRRKFPRIIVRTPGLTAEPQIPVSQIHPDVCTG